MIPYTLKFWKIGKVAMNEDFSITAKWLQNRENVDCEDVIADISIDLLGKNLTANYDMSDNQEKASVALAPYPMALWFVSNWWRLRWEPTPSSLKPSTDWRMSHMLSAAGYGYSWPTIGFQTDGETIRITSLPTTGGDGASVIYPTSFSALISANKFEKEIESFIMDCNDKFGKTDICALWEIIQNEKNDEDLAIFRQIEARLGFDAGEGPEREILSIMDKAKNFGHSSTQELSTLLYKNDIINNEIQNLEDKKYGTIISIADADELRQVGEQKRGSLHPWEFGYYLAKQARRIWGIDGVFSTEKLCAILDISLRDWNASLDRRDNFGLGVKHQDNVFSIALNKNHSSSARFMVARIICDAITAPKDDRILPATVNKTARQKTQRAFAAELLCPIDLIKERIESDYYNEDTWGDIAEDFAVSPFVIKSQLANNNLIPQFENTNIWFENLGTTTPTYATQEFI